eukprot:scaffold226276_cov55-Attheya_sp.AAC.9
MQRYHVKEHLGDGTYGSVVRAVNKETGEVNNENHTFCDACEPLSYFSIQRNFSLKSIPMA